MPDRDDINDTTCLRVGLMSRKQFQIHDKLGILSTHVMEQGCLMPTQGSGIRERGAGGKGDARHYTTLVLNPATAHVVSPTRR